MPLCLFSYTAGGVPYSFYHNCLAVKGVDAPDEWEFLPNAPRMLLDGSLDENILGYRRIVTIDTGVVTDAVQRARIFAFLRNPGRSMTYAGSTMTVTLEGAESYAAEWLHGAETGRRYILRLKEREIQTIRGFPGFGGTFS